MINIVASAAGGKYMDNLKTAAKQAKQRLRTDFWQRYKRDVDGAAEEAQKSGKNAIRVRSNMLSRVKSVIKGEEKDEFYLKVKELLDTCGEVSDAIGRLTDREKYEKLSYEEQQRYTMELSSKYLEALEKYRREKEGQ